MLKRSLITCAFAVLMSLGLAAQPQQTTPAPSSAGTSPIVHFEGCVFPGRAMASNPPYIVPVGSVEDYLLTNTRSISGSEPGSEDTGIMYKIEQVEHERLRSLTGKRVGVTGRIEKTPEQPEFLVVSIREISGSCPSRPGSGS